MPYVHLPMPLAAELLFLLAVAWCLFWAYAASGSRALLVVMLAWGLLHGALAESGAYADATAFPPPQFLLLGPVLIALLALLLLPRGRAWLGSMPLVALTALHALRIPVELVLHRAYEAGLVPRGMTYSGHNFDIVSGITAVLMVVWLLSPRPPSRAVLIAWNIMCLVLLVIVVATAAVLWAHVAALVRLLGSAPKR